METYFGLVSVGWTVAFAVTLYLAVVRFDRHIEDKERLYKIVILGVPLILMVLPFSTGNIGFITYTCWIDESPYDTGMVW
jgi:hypothetical protein